MKPPPLPPQLRNCDLPDCHNLYLPGKRFQKWCTPSCGGVAEVRRKNHGNIDKPVPNKVPPLRRRVDGKCAECFVKPAHKNISRCRGCYKAAVALLRPCAYESCDEPALGGFGLCDGHYQQSKRNLSLVPLQQRQPEFCTVEYCSELVGTKGGKGYCPRHYSSYSRWGDPTDIDQGDRRRDGRRKTTARTAKPIADVKSKEPCPVVGCPRTQHRNGLCGSHAYSLDKYGDVLEIDRIRERKDSPFPFWTVDEEGYMVASIDGKKVYQHRLIMEKLTGIQLESWETVHHVNGEKNDNRPANLELWPSTHPSGQRVEDIVAHCVMVLNRYNPELLNPEIKDFSSYVLRA